MKIEVTVNNTTYGILVETSCYTLSRYGTNKDTTSKNFGKSTEYVLCYPTTLQRAINAVKKDAMAAGDDVVTLNEFLSRYTDVTNQLREQLEAVGV